MRTRRDRWVLSHEPIKCAHNHTIGRDVIPLPAAALQCDTRTASGANACNDWVYVLSYVPGVLYVIDVEYAEVKEIHERAMSVPEVVEYLKLTMRTVA